MATIIDKNMKQLLCFSKIKKEQHLQLNASRKLHSRGRVRDDGSHKRLKDEEPIVFFQDEDTTTSAIQCQQKIIVLGNMQFNHIVKV